jgi:hypothetical protein
MEQKEHQLKKQKEDIRTEKFEQQTSKTALTRN